MTYLSGQDGDYLEMDAETEDCADEGLPTHFLLAVWRDRMAASAVIEGE